MNKVKTIVIMYGVRSRKRSHPSTLIRLISIEVYSFPGIAINCAQIQIRKCEEERTKRTLDKVGSFCWVNMDLVFILLLVIFSASIIRT